MNDLFRTDQQKQENTGWVCPKCNRVMAPTTPVCLFCQTKNESSESGKNILLENV